MNTLTHAQVVEVVVICAAAGTFCIGGLIAAILVSAGVIWKDKPDVGTTGTRSCCGTPFDQPHYPGCIWAPPPPSQALYSDRR